MIVRRDHIAGGAFVAAGAAVLALSGDLPFGTLASPGAGMLPTLVIGLMVGFGVIVFVQAGGSPPLAAIVWDELPHASSVIAVAAACTALYTKLGFLVTMPLLLFGLLFMVERRHIVYAAVFSIGVTVLAHVLFVTLLKAPLPRGLIGY
jgi:Tripartite tricarboxylate transporter TctB family